MTKLLKQVHVARPDRAVDVDEVATRGQFRCHGVLNADGLDVCGFIARAIRSGDGPLHREGARANVQHGVIHGADVHRGIAVVRRGDGGRVECGQRAGHRRVGGYGRQGGWREVLAGEKLDVRGGIAAEVRSGNGPLPDGRARAAIDDQLIGGRDGDLVAAGIHGHGSTRHIGIRVPVAGQGAVGRQLGEDGRRRINQQDDLRAFADVVAPIGGFIAHLHGTGTAVAHLTDQFHDHSIEPAVVGNREEAEGQGLLHGEPVTPIGAIKGNLRLHREGGGCSIDHVYRLRGLQHGGVARTVGGGQGPGALEDAAAHLGARTHLAVSRDVGGAIRQPHLTAGRSAVDEGLVEIREGLHEIGDGEAEVGKPTVLTTAQDQIGCIHDFLDGERLERTGIRAQQFDAKRRGGETRIGLVEAQRELGRQQLRREDVLVTGGIRQVSDGQCGRSPARKEGRDCCGRGEGQAA